MAETLVSPGVLAREQDQSFIQRQPVSVGAAIIGPTVKGPVEIPTVVTSYSDYQLKFGTTFISGGDEYSYLTSISAYNYFNGEGGNSLLVARVVSNSGDWSYADSTAIYNSNESGVIDVTSTLTITTNSTSSTTAITSSITASTDGSGTGGVFTIGLISGSVISNISASTGGTGYAIGDTLTFASGALDTGDDVVVTLAANDLVNDTAFTLETLDRGIIMNSSSSLDTSGSLESGSRDNIRWEIQNSNTSAGTFTLLVRRGNDTTRTPVVLETYTNLSLDPKASNYITKQIGDQKQVYDSTENYITVTGNYPNRSNYIRVKSVNATTPDYFDNTGNAKSQYTASLPQNASGSFTGATGTDINAGAKYYDQIGSNTQGLVEDSYTDMIRLLANQDDYRFNILSTPGLIDGIHTSAITSIISNTGTRGDNIFVVDCAAYGSTIASVQAQAQSRDTSYAATYWPWVSVSDPDSGKDVWVPASTVIPGVYAFNDRSAAPWFAPAGVNRGGLGQVIDPERRLSQANRDSLYNSKVNPIASFPGIGPVVYGQKTLQTQASALDRVNVRRLLINLKSYISQVSQNLVFEQNSRSTRAQFLNAVNPYLESVQSRQGLYAFRVIMDDSNNTPDVIDRNQLIGQIFVQPTKTAEYIYLDFIVQPTGATFPA
jgi:phage tail sheath protein FI